MFLSRVSYSDECVFHVDEKVSKHDFWISKTENRHGTREARDVKNMFAWFAMFVQQ